MKTVVAIDFDKNACATYAANFPATDVRCARVEDEINRLPAADVIIGGPPCQSFSTAGMGLGEADGRNGWPAYVAAVRKMRPRMFLAENVAGMLTAKHIKYLAKVYGELEACGNVVQWRRFDSVNFGVPQFRDRIWVWGIRKDLWEAGMRHRWPSATHAWPWPAAGGMFGGELLPAVTVGWALNIPHRQIDGVWFGGQGSGAEAIRKPRSKKIIRRDHPVNEPCPTLEARAALGGGSAMQIVGGTMLGHGKRVEAPFKINSPSDTLRGAVPGCSDAEIHEYRWSDAMLAKHPPASPASPASAIQAKFYKGGAEGLVMVDDPKHQPHQPANSLRSGGRGHGMPNDCRSISTGGEFESRPSPTVMACDSDAHTGGPEPINNRKRNLMIRRLTPTECARLMSMPDDFKWPAKISKTAMYKIIGNGQASLMAKHMAMALVASDPQSETVISLFCGGGVGDVGFHGKYWGYLP